MKREMRFLAISSSVCGIGLWSAVEFRHTQEQAFHHALKTFTVFQYKTQDLKEKLAFLESHQEEIHFLNEKGWMTPKNRLIAAEFLENLHLLLPEISYQFSPETIKEVTNNLFFKVTRISFETRSPFDVEAYAFIAALLRQFPGILILRSFTLRRQEEEPPYIQGTVIADWIAMDKEG